MKRLLLIEDDERLGRMVADYLERAGFSVRHEMSGRAGLAYHDQNGADAVILDLMLPDLDGLDVCRQLRNRHATPILMLTARGDAMDRIIGLEMGADDYLPKPFEPRELLARLNAILRRAAGDMEPQHVLHFGRLEIDKDARAVRLDGKACQITGHQFEILLTLAEHAGRVLSRDQILDLMNGDTLDAFDRSIDVHISRIRQAIEDDPKSPKRIITVRGVGYVFAKSQE